MQKIQSLKPFKIQRSCVYDGPGIRSTIFFKGCNLRCTWCQNPEMQSFNGNITPDYDYTISEINDVISRDIDYYRSTNGGITFSGGEPLLQNPDSLINLLDILKTNNIKVAVETSLHVPWENISKILSYIDLFLVDLKIVGDEILHLKYTKQKSTLIHDNIKNLLASNANIKFRMVMVPGYTDGENNIQATSEFLKSINHDSIELMKFHNLYEEKAQRLGLNVESLNITPEQSLASIKKSIRLFQANGIKANNIELNTIKHSADFTQRVKSIQKDIRESGRALCVESARLKTKYYKKHGFKKSTHIHRGESLLYTLQRKSVKIYPGELLVGNFSSKRVAGTLWVDYMGIVGIKMIYKITRLKPIPFKATTKEILSFLRMVPFWLKHSLLGKVNPKISDLLLILARSSEMNAGFNNNFAAICHFIANYDRILKLGTIGLIDEIKGIKKEKSGNDQDFYEGVIIALKGLEVFAQKYADHLSKLSLKEKDPVRQKELEEMAKICKQVPKYPARTFNEALQSILFIHIALCIEQYENAISFGRLDQILYPYYKKDKDAGIITYEKAKELLCLFVLKMDEDILVNDGQTFLELFSIFETLSTDQAITFGGVDKDGKDATNEITYMLLDACELQPLAADMSARIHKGSPDEYLERIAQLYIDGCPLPQLFSDDIYIDAIQNHYPTSLENARNYSIVGCVEPNASDDHFGNTDCANINITLPLLQAIKGHEHDLWNYGFYDRLLILITNFLTYTLKGKNKFSRLIIRVCKRLIISRNNKRGFYKYNPPSNMNELLERFQTRLNHLTNSILTDHQKIERELRKNFTTPLASSLFKGCLVSGKDLYEGGATFNSCGIQAVGVTDVADSLFALDEVVFKKKLYTINEIIKAIENNFQGSNYPQIRSALLEVPKFGNDSSPEAIEWLNKVLVIYNKALESVENCPRNGRYSAGYYALNTGTIYGKNTPALPSGRLKGVPLSNSIIPHYGMEQTDLLSSLNSIAKVNFKDHAENGATASLTIDSSFFQGSDGVQNLANIFKTFLINGGMQLQPNVINRELLLDAYNHPEKHKYLVVRIAGYCAYFNELTDELKKIIINRSCYTVPFS